MNAPIDAKYMRYITRQERRLINNKGPDKINKLANLYLKHPKKRKKILLTNKAMELYRFHNIKVIEQLEEAASKGRKLELEPGVSKHKCYKEMVENLSYHEKSLVEPPKMMGSSKFFAGLGLSLLVMEGIGIYFGLVSPTDPIALTGMGFAGAVEGVYGKIALSRRKERKIRKNLKEYVGILKSYK